MKLKALFSGLSFWISAILLLVIGWMLGCGRRTFPPHGDPARLREPAETVVLLHGLMRSSRAMHKLARRLSVNGGYRVEVWDYPSTRKTIVEHGDWLDQKVRALEDDPNVTRIHFVTHSLGGIITRQLLMKRIPKKMGRVVMIAPPNKGSASARHWAWLGVWRPLQGLSDVPESQVNRMPPAPPEVEIGVIAGKSDAKVSVASTHLTGEADHVVVSGFHSFIMNSKDVFEHVASFLKTGKFKQ